MVSFPRSSCAMLATDQREGYKRHFSPGLATTQPQETLSRQYINRLRVSRRAIVASLGSGVGPQREMSAVPSEKCVVHWGSEYDEMRMITTSFARVLERCTGHMYMRSS